MLAEINLPNLEPEFSAIFSALTHASSAIQNQP
jgi:hypothetical protein